MLPLDLHVLSLSLAFILSQDQTLLYKKFYLVKNNNLVSIPTRRSLLAFNSRHASKKKKTCPRLVLLFHPVKELLVSLPKVTPRKRVQR